jgi:hypothetical protein
MSEAMSEKMSEKLLSDGHPRVSGAVSETSGLICAFYETTVSSETYTVGINEGKKRTTFSCAVGGHTSIPLNHVFHLA